MSEGKGVKQKWGGKLVELFTPKKPEQSPEPYAEAFADDVAEKIRDALAKEVQQDEHRKQEMADELIKRARSLAYSFALREVASPRSKAEITGEDEEAIRAIGKLLVEVKGLRGAPVKKRELFLEALEKHLSGLTWTELTKEICDCGKSKHDFRCKESIRSGANELKSLLRQYNIGDVPPLDQERSKKIKMGRRGEL